MRINMVNRLRQLTMLSLISLLLACGKPGQVIETYSLKKGTFRFTVTETGELVAVNARSISAPMIDYRLGSLKISQLVDDGAEVKEGDMLVEFDKSEVQKRLQDSQAELEIAQAELRKAVASQKSQIEGLEADLEKSRLQHEIAKLNVELSGHQAAIDKKRLELQLNDAAIDLDQAIEKLRNQKRLNEQDIAKLELKVNQAKNKLDDAYTTIELLTVLAPAPGIAIIEKNWSTDTKFQVDDQPWRGSGLIRLPDLSLMQANVMINEVDIAKIDSGQTAQVTMDAYPDTSFSAHVSNVATLARNKERGSKVKIFDVMLLLDENDKKLMPGMTVSCEILIDQIDDTLFIPLEAVFMNENGPYVYLKKGRGFEQKSVETGPENDDHVIIIYGLEETDEIALSDPELITGSKADQKKEMP